MVHVLVEALIWTKRSLHLQCYVSRAFFLEILNLSPYPVSLCCSSGSVGQKGDPLEALASWRAGGGPAALPAALGFREVHPELKWRSGAGSSHFLTFEVLEVAELPWKVFTKGLDFFF